MPDAGFDFNNRKISSLLRDCALPALAVKDPAIKMFQNTKKAAVRIAILDACRDNPFPISAQEIAKASDVKRSINAGLANVSGPETIETQAASGPISR